MPGIRRTISKSQGFRQFGLYSLNDEQNKSRPNSSESTVHQIGAKSRGLPVVRHIPLPSIPSDSQLLFEIIAFFCTVEALSLQYLNLYRTIWWLPHSHVDYAINFYLIDPFLTGFIIILLARRLVWCIMKQIIGSIFSGCPKNVLTEVFRVMYGCFLIGSLTTCAFYIIQRHPIVKMFYLCYPISIYFILFGANASSFFELIPSFVGDKRFGVSKHESQNGIAHFCYLSPEAVRNEVDLLKADFNVRMKQVLFNSLLSAYYTGFIPCCFAQNILHYDIHFVTQHMGFTWLGCFITYIVHMYPPQYCDVLHRTALHLGHWQKVESKNFHIPYSQWSEYNLWHQGALVKHMKELYRAEGIVNAAEPGNTTHARFGHVFSNPALLCCIFLLLQIINICVQILLLFRIFEWYRVISIAMLASSNYYTLFKQVRDYVILRKVYKAEELCQEESSN